MTDHTLCCKTFPGLFVSFYLLPNLVLHQLKLVFSSVNSAIIYSDFRKPIKKKKKIVNR